ncbi:MAG TPA: outer membrane lipoprotein carrier protein LolA [Gemmatimonadaceae bacterium]|nr:outer membrane lipoprotein carrier protein LolA [Gemmatimonadaceae bacterium]
MRAAFASAALASALGAQDSTGALLDRAVREYASIRTVRAPFEQTLTNPNTNSTRTAKGEFFQRGRSRFALRFSDPAGDAIISDGEALWVYLPSSAKGQVLKMPREAGAGLDFLTQLLTAPREHYAVSVLGDATVGARATAAFALTPKGATAPFTRATLWVGRADAFLWQVETVEPSGLVRRVRFTAIRTNVTLPRDALTFRVPEGVRVIDQVALLGGKP